MTTDVRPFAAGDEAGVRAVMEASLATDGIPGFVRSDIERAMVRIVPDPDGTVVALEDDRVVGYCTPNHDDLTVLPAARRRGHGRRLIAAAREVVRRRGQPELQLYVPSRLPGSIAFAERLGFTYRSSLWMFVLAAGQAVPAPAFPADVVVRTWDPARDTDLEAWTAFMHRAFEGHTTPRQAGTVAATAGVARLVLVHFSPRWTMSAAEAIEEIRAGGFAGDAEIGREFGTYTL